MVYTLVKKIVIIILHMMIIVFLKDDCNLHDDVANTFCKSTVIQQTKSKHNFNFFFKKKITSSFE